MTLVFTAGHTATSFCKPATTLTVLLFLLLLWTQRFIWVHSHCRADEDIGKMFLASLLLL